MASWIFQGNPSLFDIDGYLHSTPGAITWLAKQHSKEIAVGDTVYLWRSQGGDKSEKRSGVIASAEITSHVAIEPEEQEARRFWIDKTDVDKAEPRVWLKLVRVANKKEELKRDWLAEDADLKEMLILRQPAGTNFRLRPVEAERLRKMWSRVGQDWSRAESLAGLWAYVETLNKEVSRSKDSPVGIVSKITGRSISGVYNKVMNYRSIDPRDERKGMSGAGKTDRTVWNEFFNLASNDLDEQAIRGEFDRLWGDAQRSVHAPEIVDASSENEIFESEVGKLLDRSIEELMAAYGRQQKHAKKSTGTNGKPKARTGKTTLYDRNALVVAIGKRRAKNQCELPGCTHDLFEDGDGKPYCEVHHITPLSSGGLDVIENVVCLCPAHHKEAHFGKNAPELKKALVGIRATP